MPMHWTCTVVLCNWAVQNTILHTVGLFNNKKVQKVMLIDQCDNGNDPCNWQILTYSLTLWYIHVSQSQNVTNF